MSVGTLVELSCNSQRRIEGSATATCQANSTWTPIGDCNGMTKGFVAVCKKVDLQSSTADYRMSTFATAKSCRPSVVPVHTRNSRRPRSHLEGPYPVGSLVEQVCLNDTALSNGSQGRSFACARNGTATFWTNTDSDRCDSTLHKTWPKSRRQRGWGFEAWCEKPDGAAGTVDTISGGLELGSMVAAGTILQRSCATGTFLFHGGASAVCEAGAFTNLGICSCSPPPFEPERAPFMGKKRGCSRLRRSSQQ